MGTKTYTRTFGVLVCTTAKLLYFFVIARIEFDTRHIVVQALAKRLNYMKIATCTEIKSNIRSTKFRPNQI